MYQQTVETRQEALEKEKEKEEKAKLIEGTYMGM